MCIPLAQDPKGVLWSIAVFDTGLYQSTSTPRVLGLGPPVINDGVNTWNFSIDSQGRIVTTSGAVSSNTGYHVLSYFTGISELMSIDSVTGRLQTTAFAGAVPTDLPPVITNVTRSNWPSTTPIFCNTCGQAGVTEMADLGGWCCTCQSYVLPEDCTTFRVIDE